jgi:hypothetical protein
MDRLADRVAILIAVLMALFIAVLLLPIYPSEDEHAIVPIVSGEEAGIIAVAEVN